MNLFRILSAVSLLLLAIQTGISHPSQSAEAVKPDDSFFAVAVCYGGGKVRAPMLERLDATSAQRWGRDLDQIKAEGQWPAAAAG